MLSAHVLRNHGGTCTFHSPWRGAGHFTARMRQPCGNSRVQAQRTDTWRANSSLGVHGRVTVMCRDGRMVRCSFGRTPRRGTMQRAGGGMAPPVQPRASPFPLAQSPPVPCSKTRLRIVRAHACHGRGKASKQALVHVSICGLPKCPLQYHDMLCGIVSIFAIDIGVMHRSVRIDTVGSIE